MDQRTRADRALPPLRPEREVAPETTGEIGDVLRAQGHAPHRDDGADAQTQKKLHPEYCDVIHRESHARSHFRANR